ncbi:MAG: hypothetical protein KBC32_07840 [Candidatus Didemnitutus sp.]|nr:hypothetical protein [Candidatus Didemnitutus sp.]
MKTPQISVLIDRADYELCAAAARLARQATGKNDPDTRTLIAFQFKFRTAEALAKDYLDCIGEREARFNVSERSPRHAGAMKLRAPREKKSANTDALRSVRKPADLSRN